MTRHPEAAGSLSDVDLARLDSLLDNLRTWRNHWAEVQRVTADFPEDIRKTLVLRPTDPEEALQQTLPQFAVLFHPDAQQALVEQLNDVLGVIEQLVDANRQDSSPSAGFSSSL